MLSHESTAAAILALATMSGPLAAAPRCATPVDEAAFRRPRIQQQLMVAALTCHNIDEYNRFVTCLSAAAAEIRQRAEILFPAPGQRSRL